MTGLSASKFMRGFLVALVLLAFAYRAGACSCGGRPISPCQSLNGSDVIFFGTVESVEERPWSEFWQYFKTHPAWSWRERYAMFRDEVVVNFRVQESYRGIQSQRASVRVAKFVGACGFEYKPGELFFKKGVQYLVYAGDYAGRLATNHCSGTKLAAYAGKEIEAYRRLLKIPGPRIVGTYSIRENRESSSPAADQVVRFTASNGKVLTAKVAPDGTFVLASVPSGVYTLNATVPPKYKALPGNCSRISDDVPINPKSVKLESNGCAEVEMDAYPDGHISGKVLDSKGRPLTDVTIRVWEDREAIDQGTWWNGNQPNQKGEFDITPLVPGDYYLGFFIWSEEQSRRFRANDDSARPTLYFYPGVTDLKKAKRVTLGFGQHRSDIRLIVPAVR